MPTLQQSLRGARRKKIRRSKSYRLLGGKPQIAGVVISVLTIKPKKPNSANRAIVKVRLSNGLVTFAFVPGEKNPLQPHQKVLMRAGVRKDLIGIRLFVIRGAKRYDCQGVKGRKTSRSSYGAPRPVLKS